MGILDMLLKLDARRQGAVLDDQEARLRRQQTEQGVGLAKQLYRSGKRDDPAAQQAVGLMSDPGSRALGVQQAANVLDPAYQQGQQLGALQIEGQQGANRVGALREAFIPTEQQFARDQAGYAAAQDRRLGAESGQRLKLNDLALQAAMAPPARPTEAEAFKAETGLDLPKDFMVVRNPYTKVNQAVPMPNTSLYNAAADEIAKQQAAVTSLTQFLFTMDQAGASGTEYIGPLAKELKKRRYDVMAALRLSGNLGTPTGGEQKMVDDLLPDPTNEWRNMYGAEVNVLTGGLGSEYFKRNITAPYEAMRSDAEAKLKALQERYHYIPVTPGVVAGR